MLDVFVILLTIFVLFISVKMSHNNHSVEVEYITSPLDQHEYLVRNLPDKAEAAKLLSVIRQNLINLIDYLKNKYPNDGRVIRVFEKFRPDQITESSANSAYTSYSVNKGEQIVFCLRQRDEQEQLIDINTMTFVAIHELAHLMTESVGHTTEFWENMKFLLSSAMSDDLQIYKYQPYHTHPQSYCGTMISDTPIKLSVR